MVLLQPYCTGLTITLFSFPSELLSWPKSQYFAEPTNRKNKALWLLFYDMLWKNKYLGRIKQSVWTWQAMKQERKHSEGEHSGMCSSVIQCYTELTQHATDVQSQCIGFLKSPQKLRERLCFCIREGWWPTSFLASSRLASGQMKTSRLHWTGSFPVRPATVTLI